MAGVILIALTAVCYALVASRLDRWSVTAPMVFVAVGVAVAPRVSGLLEATPTNETVQLLAEVTLALLLFSDASTIRLREVAGETGLPTRLLGIGFPLALVFGTLMGRLLLPDAGWAGAALIAAILTPTDAALGLGIFTNRAVPVRVRRALNVESGLNDGLATPFVTLFLALVAAEEFGGGTDWLAEAVVDIALAVVAAVGVGLIGGWAVREAHRRGWTSSMSEDLAFLSLAGLAYGLALAIGGNGFVAAFLAGLLCGAAAGRELTRASDFTERLGLFSSFVVWALFGAVFAAPVLMGDWSVTAIAYAVASLTIVRMAAVGVALRGSRLSGEAVLFMGWFGPRGLASVVFALIAYEELVATALADLVAVVATWTILLSVVAHGLSAGPLAARYGRHAERLPAEHPELAPAPEPALRRSMAGRHASVG